ncbi:hypothetical protein CHARACLAT_031931 [Characodon lateralis]|uniref:Uncharacterized protein n=1 Tax=Characodon lateralis TaxID=208331 RepID=A0ABU7D2D8_9TELE|nr:hypothetical protein [Characodon lateralis]
MQARSTAGNLVKLCQRGQRALLPSIHLANVPSLVNKTDKLLFLCTKNPASADLPHYALPKPGLVNMSLLLLGFQMLCTNRSAELSLKTEETDRNETENWSGSVI